MRRRTDTWFALSVRQPWAALLVAGVKSVEVRSWPTTRRGRILIHAGKAPDLRPQGWEWLETTELRALAGLTGGVIGSGELADCIEYPTRPGFVADRGRHLNEPDWFRDGGLQGFVFRHLRIAPFYPCRGQTFFFRVYGFRQIGLPVPASGKP